MTSSEASFTVLDHIDSITVPGNPFAEPANEYWALVCLRDGLEDLYRNALACDQEARSVVNPHGDVRFVGFGNIPGIERIPKTLLTCWFHWYAISACQYVRTVGAIALRQDSSRPKPADYAASIIPEVVAFRDKVAAHFAWGSKNKMDNAAERVVSILPSLSFSADSFHVGAVTVHVRRGSKSSDSGTIKPWSLCRVHESLRKRYWPQLCDST